ncbi:PhzF family phenazine biosynthesis protein [Kitasatospora sp. MAP12-15]|uniref:PhzF family phenazine biosynthesis protein n=1 Tax=unclassified Kitasatospora TaxID=2633591 RepID=UPI0024735114|nr:PhzF family phenazine biosynthesis protein [Kitasatospora sp. MAP12-44]MDH6109002.1 PhzF family phenazine biosynthesis protein [Kitasatospora sp. MAP12-44]
MRIKIIDAFTERPFAGNPAAVCLLEGPEWPAEQWMRQVAREMKHSETAFVRPLPAEQAAQVGAEWALRWFTPMTEVALCGHGTLATAHALRSEGLIDSGPARFTTLSGVLTTTAPGDGTVCLDFPAAPLLPAEIPAGLEEALGSRVTGCWTTGPLDVLLVLLRSEHSVRGLAPDFAGITRQDTGGIAVTARAEDPSGGYDFVSRYFAPAAGVAEDPVTGSAHTALAPFWAERLDRLDDTLTGYQASPRGGLIRCRLHGDRVLLSGHAVTVVDGILHSTP